MVSKQISVMYKTRHTSFWYSTMEMFPLKLSFVLISEEQTRF